MLLLVLSSWVTASKAVVEGPILDNIRHQSESKPNEAEARDGSETKSITIHGFALLICDESDSKSPGQIVVSRYAALSGNPPRERGPAFRGTHLGILKRTMNNPNTHAITYNKRYMLELPREEANPCDPGPRKAPLHRCDMREWSVLKPRRKVDSRHP